MSLKHDAVIAMSEFSRDKHREFGFTREMEVLPYFLPDPETRGVPLAAADYLKLAHEFHTIVLDHIPVMDFARRNEAKRFIILIDTLYDNGVKLMASAEADPVSLYVATEGIEANEFKRTSSRLIEMSSQSYLARPHGDKDSSASGATTGLVET